MERLAKLETQVEELTKTIDRLIESVDRLEERLNAPKWGVLAAWAGVGVTLLGLFQLQLFRWGSGVEARVERLEHQAMQGSPYAAPLNGAVPRRGQ